MTHSSKQRPTYDKPSVMDYGSLVELTAANGLAETEDGIGKILNTDGSSGSIIP
jgi:hypothetical protein